jgi:outer membrane immunogenic protein
LTKSLGIAAAALSLLAGSAFAADLPTRKGPPPEPVYVPPLFTWTGFYVGLNAGGYWTNSNHNNDFGFGFNGGNGNSGFIGGGQIGYNYQFTPGAGFVIGAEADIDWASNNNRSNNGFAFGIPVTPGTTVFAGSGHSSSDNYIGTVRARAGYAFDRFLVYATGGLAYGQIGRNSNNGAFAVTQAGFVNPFTGTLVGATTVTPLGFGTGSGNNTGWTVGGGVEWAVWNNWSVKAEYLYYNLGSGRNNNNGFITPVAFGAAPFIGATGHHNQDGNIFRVGVNYRFW